MILDAGGRPLATHDSYRAPDPPADILARLHQIDPKLGLLWSPKTRDNVTGEIVLLPHWMLTMGWRDDDPRWAMVRRGDMAPGDAFDRIGDLPPDCAVEDAYGWFVANVKRWRGDKDEVTRLLSRAHHFNAQREKEIMDDTLSYADELIEANATHLFASIGKTFTKMRQAGFGLGTITRWARRQR